MIEYRGRAQRRWEIECGNGELCTMFDELAKKYVQRAAQLKGVHCSSHERSAAAQSDGELLTDVVVGPAW